MPFFLNGKEVDTRTIKSLFKWNDDILSWIGGPRPGSKFIINGKTLEYKEEEGSDE